MTSSATSSARTMTFRPSTASVRRCGTKTEIPNGSTYVKARPGRGGGWRPGTSCWVEARLPDGRLAPDNALVTLAASWWGSGRRSSIGRTSGRRGRSSTLVRLRVISAPAAAIASGTSGQAHDLAVLVDVDPLRGRRGGQSRPLPAWLHYRIQ